MQMSRRLALERLDVRGGRPLRTARSLVGDLRALGERLESTAYDRRVVDEQVLTLVVGRDESVALLVAEPLNGSGCHVMFPPGIVRVLRNAGGARGNNYGRWH